MTLNNAEPDIPVTSDIPEPDIPVASDIPGSHIPMTDIPLPDIPEQFETNDTVIQVREFPDAFYGPMTKKLMHDPVVISDGNSYERSSLVEQRGDDIESGGKPYPNRALLAIIDETIEMSGHSFMPMMRQLQQRAGSGVRQIFDLSALSNREFRPLPDVYYCPITFGLIHFPVIDPEGNTFERVAIEAWIQKNGSSPITRTSLRKEDLYCNHAISALLDEEKRKDASNIHPSIRRFIDEAPPQAPPASSDPGGTQVRVYLFPTTPEEMAARRRLTRHERCTSFVGLVFVLLFVILLPFYGAWLFILPLWAVFFCTCATIRERDSS